LEPKNGKRLPLSQLLRSETTLFLLDGLFLSWSFHSGCGITTQTTVTGNDGPTIHFRIAQKGPEKYYHMYL
jgi:hypothetical protein